TTSLHRLTHFLLLVCRVCRTTPGRRRRGALGSTLPTGGRRRSHIKGILLARPGHQYRKQGVEQPAILHGREGGGSRKGQITASQCRYRRFEVNGKGHRARGLAPKGNLQQAQSGGID